MYGDIQVVMKIGYKWGTYLVKRVILGVILGQNQRIQKSQIRFQMTGCYFDFFPFALTSPKMSPVYGLIIHFEIALHLEDSKRGDTLG